MAKRYQPLKEFGRTTKKPKLEVSINKNPPGASTSKAADGKPKSPPTQKASAKPIDDLWDDDEDDDVLLLATQVAESEIAAGSKTSKQVVDITESEITFSEFEPKIVQHSTQQPTQNLFSQMFDEDDDDIALLAAAIEKDAKRHERKHTKKEDEDAIFKKPALPLKAYQRDDISDDEPGTSFGKQKLPVSQYPCVSTKPKDSSKPQFEDLPEDMIIDVDELDPSFPTSAKESIPPFAERPHEIFIDVDDDDDEPGPSTRQKPMQIPQAAVQSSNDQNQGSDQVKDLLKRLEALKNENEKLSSALTNVKDTMQTKSGEASVLRDELRQTKQKLDELKMAKVFQTETINAEGKKKIEELSKKVQEKEAELQLKNMECSVLKMRQTDETRRFETTTMTTTSTTGDTTIPPNVGKTDSQVLIDEESLREISDVQMWQPTLRIECEALLPQDHVYESVKIESQLKKKWNTFITEELSNLQRLLAKVQNDIYNVSDETSDEIIESVRKVFKEFTIYVEDLNYGFNEKVLPEHDYNVLDEKNVRPASCMHFSTPLYPGERVRNLRRYIAVLAVIFDRSPDVTRNFLAAIHDEKPLLNLAISFIYKIGCSLQVYQFFGVFEAFALILRTTLYHLDPEDVDDKPYSELLFNLLREIVFARPGPWAMYELSFSVIDIHERFPSMLSSFCINSPPETFTIDRQKGVYRFSDKSCLMQVYSGLTESSFPLYEPLNEEMFNLQTKICLNHIRFVFYCVTEPPDFIQKILSTYEEEDDSTDEEFFQEWIKRLCETDEELNEINEFFFKRPNANETSAKKPQEENVSAKTTSKTTTHQNFEDEQPAPNKEPTETLRKEKDDETTSRTYATFSDEKPTTSKKAAEAASKELVRIEQPTASRAKQPTESEVNEEGTNDQSSTTSNTAKTSTQCQCFEQLCLSAVRMIWLSLRQWLRFVKLVELERVRMISRVAVHLIYFLFSDNYLTCLLREDEDTTKHLMYLIYNWWMEHEKDLEFEEIQEEMLKKIKNSPIIPKLFCEEEDKPENVAKDYAEWCRISGLKFDPEACKPENLERAIKNLRLVEDATDIDLFMEFMEPPNLDMESFEFKGFTEDDDDYDE